MPIGKVDVKLRPIRLAFLVRPSDRNALHRAIMINTFFWGGLFNPIIPYYDRIPNNWRNNYDGKQSAKEIVKGYINAYSPDYLVALGDFNVDKSIYPEANIIDADEILSHIKDDGTPMYGVGLFEILKHYYEKEARFLRKEPKNIIIPELTGNCKLFLSSVFGVLNEDVDRIVSNNFDELLDIERPPISTSTYTKYLSMDNLFPRRLAMEGIEQMHNTFHGNKECIFLMDGCKSLDIIDYWNLRALGWNVIPIAMQAAHLDEVKKTAIDFIEDNFIYYSKSTRIFSGTTVLKSRNTSDKALNEFILSLNIKQDTNNSPHKLCIQNWYPRIWDDWARESDNASPPKLIAKEEDHDLQAIPEKISIRSLDLEFANRFGGHGTPRYANELEIRLYGDDGDLYASVIPDGLENIAHTIGAFGFREWRVTKDSLVYLVDYKNSHITFAPPQAKRVMSAWLESKGWRVELSTSGLISYQMLRQLGGTWGIGILKRKDLIELLSSMSDGKPVLQKSLWGNIQKICNKDNYSSDPKYILELLTEKNILRLGVVIQCPVCQQHSWHSLTDFSYETECSICLNESKIPSHSPDEIKWAYRSFGAFSLPKQAFGVYTVLLTYFFFSHCLDGSTTPLMSFTAKKNDIEIEADLSLFFQRFMYGKMKRELLFVESKTFNRFEKKDIERMRVLSREFPNSIIVFSTLNHSLTEKEKKLIKPLAKNGRKTSKGETSSPVLILTANELFFDMRLTNTYENIGGKHAEFSDKNLELHKIKSLCDITQQLYLDMEPWSEWFLRSINERP